MKTPIKDLNELLRGMNPETTKGEFVFITSKKPLELESILTFKEKEGITYILEKELAIKNSFNIEGIWKMITLKVNSDLQAIGFLAKITEALAKEKISVNAVSAYYHDHLFVPKEKAKKALKILKNLTK